jgi:hypothetical protein
MLDLTVVPMDVATYPHAPRRDLLREMTTTPEDVEYRIKE